MNTRNRASQLVILLAGPYGDLVTFEDENNAWIISTRKYRSAALRKLVEDLTPRIRKRWTTSPYALRHLVLYDIPLSASNYPPFTGASHMQIQAEHDNGDLVYALADSDHMVAARFINNCGTISLEIERNPGLQLDSVRLEKLTASDFTESERFEEALSDPCCCCLIS
ncbi:uncharacterized protein [Watersipora subatra]|uniref:uncharacterized protein n=1 Tax=Watersipora subatra TaxID=2589382 RepID=UPI00355BDB38